MKAVIFTTMLLICGLILLGSLMITKNSTWSCEVSGNYEQCCSPPGLNDSVTCCYRYNGTNSFSCTIIENNDCSGCP